MKSDDPKLTAYALGELSPRESHEVKMAIENRPDLQQEVDDIRAFEAMFGGKDKLTPEQRAAVFQFGNADEQVVEFPLKRSKLGVVALLGAAAVVVISLTMLRAPQPQGGSDVASVDWSDWSDVNMLKRVAVNSEEWSENKVVASEKRAGLEKLKVHAAAYRSEVKQRASKKRVAVDLDSQLSENQWVKVDQVAVSRIPLLAGNASYTWVADSLNQGGLPHPSLVREEELLNVDVPQMQADMIVGGVAGGVELVKSPWDTSGLLVFVRIAGENKVSTQAAVKFSDKVRAYRTLGYSENTSALEAPAEQQMQHSHLAVYELQLQAGSFDNTTEIVTLEMQVRADGSVDSFVESDSLRVLFTAPEWSELPHQGLRHSLLVASWAKWLKQPSNESLRVQLKEQLESATPSNAQQEHTHRLIQQSLELRK